MRWSRSYEFSAQTAVATSVNGEVVVAGLMWSEGNFFLTLTKYDGAGQELWREQLFEADKFFNVNDVALDAKGDVLVAGTTASDVLPTNAGALATTRMGATSGFVLKWSDETRAVEWATYIGGTAQRTGFQALNLLSAIAIGDGGTIYGIGTTNTVDFPGIGVSSPSSLQGFSDDVVFALAADGTALQWSAYIGGAGLESPIASDWALTSAPRTQDIALDQTGNPVVAGLTASTDFPVTDGALQQELAGDVDLYVAKLDKATGVPVWATYLGGSGAEQGVRLAVDDSDRVLTAASTNSDDFPATAGSFQPSSPWTSGANLGVVSALTTAGGLDWSTYFASDTAVCSGDVGCGALVPYGISVWRNAVAITGRVDGNAVPTTGDALFNASQGDGDVFVAVFDGAGSTLDFAGYIGGESEDYGTAVAHGPDGELYVIGQTASADFPLTSGATPEQDSGFALLLAEPGTLGALPRVWVNGGPGPLSVTLGEQVVVDISLLPRDAVGTDADWWVAANTPYGWYSYSDELKQWVHVGQSHLDLIPTFQRPLEELLPQQVISTSGLDAGRYGVYFGVDLLQNGTLDMDHLVHRRGVVEIED